jgi:hypothetical protein
LFRLWCAGSVLAVASTPRRRGSRAGSRRLGLCQLRVCDVGAGRDQSIASARADQHHEQRRNSNRDEDGERDCADPGCSAGLACSVPRSRSGGHDRASTGRPRPARWSARHGCGGAGPPRSLAGDHESSANAEHREREAPGGADAGIAPVKPGLRGVDSNDRLRRARLICSCSGDIECGR